MSFEGNKLVKSLENPLNEEHKRLINQELNRIFDRSTEIRKRITENKGRMGAYQGLETERQLDEAAKKAKSEIERAEAIRRGNF